MEKLGAKFQDLALFVWKEIRRSHFGFLVTAWSQFGNAPLDSIWCRIHNHPRIFFILQIFTTSDWLSMMCLSCWFKTHASGPCSHPLINWWVLIFDFIPLWVAVSCTFFGRQDDDRRGRGWESLKAVDSLFLANLLACLHAKSASWQLVLFK